MAGDAGVMAATHKKGAASLGIFASNIGNFFQKAIDQLDQCCIFLERLVSVLRA